MGWRVDAGARDPTSVVCKLYANKTDLDFTSVMYKERSSWGFVAWWSEGPGPAQGHRRRGQVLQVTPPTLT